MTNIGINIEVLSDLGIDTESTVVSEETAERKYKSTLVKGSVLAKVLYGIYSGNPVIVVPSPPGGGKSTLIAQLVNQLHVRDNLSMVIATPTKRAAAEIARTIHHELGAVRNESTGHMESKVNWRISSEALRPEELEYTVNDTNISIRTVSSCISSPPECEVMLIDEAWQTINAHVAPAADNATQLVLVGDSGQIAPVIDIDTSQFLGEFAPHLRAPDSFAKMDNALTIPINATYRLGADTVSVIAPLYDFEFKSHRPDRSIIHRTRGRMNEIETVEFDQVASPDDSALMKNIFDRAVGYIGALVEQPGAETIALDQSDIAVLVAHNVQSSALTAMFTAQGYTEILVGTADKLQGSQRHAVVSLDPLAGQSAASDHHTSTGRACVMLSRHLTHLTWAYPSNWRELLEESELEDAAKGIEIREQLMELNS